uniref:C2H2-type domain-containing protein n=1 Tax=Timema cristinae TaxID=61476 RepID=A0A7R9GYG9_TIMCR|nr:unnamed protein product [Timema cristinae]
MTHQTTIPPIVLRTQNAGSNKSDESQSSWDLYNKYLHKKFKKMATPIPNTQRAAVEKDYNEAEDLITVNGIDSTKCANEDVTFEDKGEVKWTGLESDTYGMLKSLNKEIPPVENESITRCNSGSETSTSSTPPSQGRYLCPYCKLACAKPSVLQKHIRAHTNERPYPCLPCGFAFKTKSNLYKHCRSRAHALKMEEDGSSNGSYNKLNLTFLESSDIDEDEDTNSNTSPPLSCNTTVGDISTKNISKYSTPYSDTSVINCASGKSLYSNQERPRQIYKPKFHKAALYQENCEKEDCVDGKAMFSQVSDIKTNESHSPQNLNSLNSRNALSPNSEYLQRHITKIISENQTIVETVNPLWNKKFLQRHSSREFSDEVPGSPLPAESFPEIDLASLPPNEYFKHSQLKGSSSYMSNLDPEIKKTPTNILEYVSQSKLATTLLLRPRAVDSLTPVKSEGLLSTISQEFGLVGMNNQQPLNLSTSKHITDKNFDAPPGLGTQHRKRFFSELNSHSFEYNPTTDDVTERSSLTDSSIIIKNSMSHGKKVAKQPRLENPVDKLTSLNDPKLSSDNTSHPKNPEGSIIKDLLLKAREAQAANMAVSTEGGIYSLNMDTHTDAMHFLPSESTRSPFVCSLCNIVFKNADNLNVHHLYYCKREPIFSNHSVYSSQHNSTPGGKLRLSSNKLFRSSPVNKTSEESPMKYMAHKDLSTHNKTPQKSFSMMPTLTDLPKQRSVVPSFPSPGPLLGNTPLVDSYPNSHQRKKDIEVVFEDYEEHNRRRGSNTKKRRLDSDISSRGTSSTTSSPDTRPMSTTPILGTLNTSTGTLRSLEELSMCPMRPNSLQMFGGEVQIIDGAGETKTMRIEPSSRGNKTSTPSGTTSGLILNTQNHLNACSSIVSSRGSDENKRGDIISRNVSPHIVTMARSGLNSGGTIVQVAQKTTLVNSATGANVKSSKASGSMSVSPISPRERSLSSPLKSTQQNSNGGVILNASISPSSFSSASTLLASTTEMISKIYPDKTKLLVPIIPNITAPNLAVPGIPVPNIGHGHHLPFVPYSSILPDGTMMNPLSNITAYNPLTLQAHSTIFQNTPHILHSLNENSPQKVKDKRSMSMHTNIPQENVLPPYTGGVVTIFHGGKPIPYVPGMPGPQSLSSNIDLPFTLRKELSPKPLDLASPTKDIYQASKLTDNHLKLSKSPYHVKNTKVQAQQKYVPLSSNAVTSENIQTTLSTCIDKDDSSLILYSKCDETSSPKPSSDLSKVLNLKTTSVTTPSDKITSAISSLNSLSDKSPKYNEDNLKLDKNISLSNTKKSSKCVKGIDTMPTLKETPEKEKVAKKVPKLSVDTTNESSTEKKNQEDGTVITKFRRPTSLPLKPGTFVPKKTNSNGLMSMGMVLSLVSPETPRPKKSYGQLYLNGHAYTYLGLKCSTRAFYCTLNRPQPMYVLQSPEHATLSMYSNWKTCLEADPNPFGLEPGHAMCLYDSRHRPAQYSVAKPHEKQPMILTHSSYWLDKHKLHRNKEAEMAFAEAHGGVADQGTKTNGQEVDSSGEDPPKRVQIFAGGFESNEDYIYVRGRGRGRYVCEECGIRCKKPSMLKKHIRTHTDVRPFTCKHCNFSFKTKGNLTKHMKSKAHYKKCVELGIVPVPTMVDESNINEECLARQQALRASQYGDGGETDSDENDDDEDDEDDDEEDDDDDEMVEEHDEVNKGLLEHEAACSLLSLSELTHVKPSSSQLHYASAGLIPISSYLGRPNTYPYNVPIPIPDINRVSSNALNISKTPTLSTFSAQNEREKVSRNTGLALEIRSKTERKNKDEDGKTSLVRLQGNTSSLFMFPPQQDYDDDNDDEDDDDDDYYDRDILSESYSDNDSDISETRDPFQPNKIKKHEMSSVHQPMDLSSKNIISLTDEQKLSLTSHPYIPSVLTSNGSRTPTTPISEILTPVSEPATLIASLCSSMERCPITSSMLVEKSLPNDPAEATMLQAYLTECALQDVRMKQHQYHYNHSQYSLVNSTTAAKMLPTSSEEESIQTSISPCLLEKEVTKNDPQTRALIMKHAQISPSSDTFNSNLSIACSISGDKDLSKKDSKCIEVVSQSHLQSSANDSVNENSNVKVAITKESEPEKISDSGECLTGKSPIVSSNNIVRNIVMGGLSFNTHHLSTSPPPVSTTSSNVVNCSQLGKPKAEFLPPSSGPLSTYVSITEDGRSVCVICNKVFSKPSQLRLHVNIHYFERPFRCESCAVSFRTKGHLQKHERSVSHQNKVSMNSTFGAPTTTNPRPFKCDDCKIAFRIHGHLAKHLRSKMHIMKLECLGKLPFGTYAEMEREGFNPNDIDTTDCENSLESLQNLAQKLYEKDPSKLGNWENEETHLIHALPHSHLSGGDTSSDEGEPLPVYLSPPPSSELPYQRLNKKQETDGHSKENHGIQFEHEHKNLPKIKSAVDDKIVSSVKTEIHKFIDRNLEENNNPKNDHQSYSKEDKTISTNIENQHQNLLVGWNNCFKRKEDEESLKNYRDDNNFPAELTNGINKKLLEKIEHQSKTSPGDGNWEKTLKSLKYLDSMQQNIIDRATGKNETRDPKKSEKMEYEDVSDVDGPLPVSCLGCSKSFLNMEEVHVHLLMEHESIENVKKSDPLLAEREKSPNTSEASNFVPTQEKSLIYEGSSKIVSCEKCSRHIELAEQPKSSSSETASAVVSGDALKKFICDLCSKKQASTESLQQHFVSNTQPRLFLCAYCDVDFLSRQQLIQHEETQHTNKKTLTMALYPQEICSVTVSELQQLKFSQLSLHEKVTQKPRLALKQAQNREPTAREQSTRMDVNPKPESVDEPCNRTRRGRPQPTAHGKKGEWANRVARGPKDKGRGTRHIVPPLKLKGWAGGDEVSKVRQLRILSLSFSDWGKHFRDFAQHTQNCLDLLKTCIPTVIGFFKHARQGIGYQTTSGYSAKTASNSGLWLSLSSSTVAPGVAGGVSLTRIPGWDLKRRFRVHVNGDPSPPEKVVS